MDSSEKVVEIQENELIDYSIVKEEYELDETSVPVVSIERTSGDFPEDSKEFVSFEITEVEPKKGHKCLECDSTFKTSYFLKRHMLKHSNIRNFECSHCSKAFKEKRILEYHLKTHTKQQPVKCDICNNTLKNSLRLKVHKRRRHTHVSHEKCQICGKEVTTKRSLRDHIRRIHEGDGVVAQRVQKKAKEQKPLIRPIISDKAKEEQKPLICPICGRLFKRKRDFQPHVDAHSITIQCNICFRIFAKKNTLSSHMRIHRPKKPVERVEPVEPVVCEICNKVFKTKTHLTCHQKIHLPVDEDSLKCIYCSKFFKKVYSLQSHMKKHHRGLPKKIGADPKCTICKTDCKSIEDLKKHIENSHGGQKRFECAICGLKAYNKSRIAKHLMTVHFKMKDLKYHKVCPICSKSYTSDSIREHMRTHSDKKMFSCDLCNKAFKTIDSVRKHKRRHNSITIECIYCKKICKNEINLGDHMRKRHRGLSLKSIVTGTPFRCSICFVTYTSLDRLENHVKTHKASYKCATCDTKFIHKHNLKRHFRKFHLKKTK